MTSPAGYKARTVQLFYRLALDPDGEDPVVAGRQLVEEVTAWRAATLGPTDFAFPDERVLGVSLNVGLPGRPAFNSAATGRALAPVSSTHFLAILSCEKSIRKVHFVLLQLEHRHW